MRRLRSGPPRRLRRARRPRARRRAARTAPPAVRASTPSGEPASARHRRGLEISTPRGAQPLAQAERQPRRLHRRRAGVERAAAEGGRGAALGDLGRRELADRVRHAQLAAGGQRLGPGAVVGRRRRDLEVAGMAEPGIDPLLRAELADPGRPPPRRRGRRRAPRRRPSARACSAARTTSRCRSRRCARSARAHSAPASSRTTRASGSSSFRCQAAHIPVKPPPTTTTSALRSPTSAGAGSTAPASSSQYPCAVCFIETSVPGEGEVSLERADTQSSRRAACPGEGTPLPPPRLPPVATFDRIAGAAAGGGGVRVRGALAHAWRLRTAHDRRPPARGRPRGGRGGRHLRRARPRRPAGRRPARGAGGELRLRRVLRAPRPHRPLPGLATRARRLAPLPALGLRVRGARPGAAPGGHQPRRRPRPRAAPGRLRLLDAALGRRRRDAPRSSPCSPASPSTPPCASSSTPPTTGTTS